MQLESSVLRASIAAVTMAVFTACAPSSTDAPTLARSDGMEAERGSAESDPGQRRRLTELAERAERIEDANDIKRLQRAFGYYFDNFDVDQMANLFAENATIEYGLDGIYVGKDRIAEYFTALADNLSADEAGLLNERMQLMPVVTVDPSGETARARWRELIMAGRLGDFAIWGEGPYENEYVKEDGVWKFSKVYWHQAVVVPYEGGWQTHSDINEGIWVSEQLPPDRPPTLEYVTWPGTHLPPFHFENPVLGATDTPRIDAAAVAAMRETEQADLRRHAEHLAHKVTRLEDENEIENLQRAYGFYIDKGFWSEAADLFADDATIEIAGSGVFAGRDRVLELLRSRGDEFPQDGRLFDRMQLQPVIHVAADGRTAQGRWRLFAQEAEHGAFSRWGVGTYQNTYIKEDGVWKIQSLLVHHAMYSDYEDGWGVAALDNPGPAADLPPDAPPSFDYSAYPNATPLPFHYENPVTSPVEIDYESVAYDSYFDGVSDEEMLRQLSARIERLEAHDDVERLQGIYGYYLAHSQWDNLAGIFTDDGTIEIAMRGIYVGREAVRRNLNLYTEVGMQHALLHNHMQYQPVIHVAEDGQSARLRSRAFSMMGEYEAYAMWMGGTYENVFEKVDGVWQVAVDRQINTYFVPYAVGWQNSVPRPPPQITESNPPDLPPTEAFEMYPSAFVPAFHYPNPVTGNEVVWTAPE